MIAGFSLPAGCARRPDRRAHARQQFRHAEGLGQVIVGTGRRALPPCRIRTLRAESTITGTPDHVRRSRIRSTPSPSGRPRSTMTTSGLRVPASHQALLQRIAFMHAPAFRLQRGGGRIAGFLSLVLDQHGNG